MYITPTPPPFGRMVHVLGVSRVWNGGNVAPAIVNQVYAHGIVSVTAFPDTTVPVCFDSIRLVTGQAEAKAACEDALKHGHTTFRIAYWPERTENAAAA